MDRCIFNSVARARCPKFSEERQIKIRLLEIIDRSGFKQYHHTHFNCLDQFDCEHFDRLNGCPFIAEVIERFS